MQKLGLLLLQDNHPTQKTCKPPKKKKKTKVSQYHLKRDQIPDEQKGTKAARFLHGYILFGLVRADVQPPVTVPATVTAFEEHWEPSFVEKLRQTLRTATTSDSGASKMVLQLRADAAKEAARGSKIAKDILEVKETHLLSAFSLVLAAGLEHWRPDLLGAPDSLYNQVHETVFLESFRKVAGNFSYVFLAPTVSGINKPTLIIDISRSFLFSYMKLKYRVEAKEPGKLAENRDNNNNSKRWGRLAEKRTAFFLQDKQPDRVVALVRDACRNSDDESGSDGDHNKVYFVNKKSICSVSAATFVHKVEKRRVKTERRIKGAQRANVFERTQIIPVDPLESDLSVQMPEKVPIDFFDPVEFNGLLAKTRFRYAQYGVALPLTMNKEMFMLKYGNDVLKLYNIPTEEEMNKEGNSGWSDDDEPIHIPEDVPMDQDL
ncbi:hypothetical protein DFH08DRAFT_930881 [Mycena albidolilacea]|uniref:Uncharacterized protein n=1 Tax=Mycena albidolilacea TaxID=1033008 RepID=A0AAD7AM73_9AGAR|nr:hypothetical protein DFH08DRAFT_930881 [Mycena albidolilacea]